MVVVQPFSFLKGYVVMRLIIEVVAQHGYGVAKFILYLLYKGALAGAGAAGDAYYDYIFHVVLLFFLAKITFAAAFLRASSLCPRRRQRKNSLLYSQRIKLTRTVSFNVLKQSLILTAHMAQACLPLQTAPAKSFETSKAGCCHKQIFSKELNIELGDVLSEPFDRAWLHSRRKQAKTLAIKLHRSSTKWCAFAILSKVCARSCYEQRGRRLACISSGTCLIRTGICL